MDTGASFVDESPEVVTPERGSELVLNCSVSTSAVGNVTWRKDGRRLAAAGGRRVRLRDAGASLVIRRVQARTDNGRYQCAAAVPRLGGGVLLSSPTTVRVAGTCVTYAAKSRRFIFR